MGRGGRFEDFYVQCTLSNSVGAEVQEIPCVSSNSLASVAIAMGSNRLISRWKYKGGLTIYLRR